MSLLNKRWAPVRKGKIYCSPGCGAGCTYKEYERAISKSNRLQKKMGPGWKTRVWENLGWHYKLTRGPISLSESGGEYIALINDDPNVARGGLSLWTDLSKRSRDPKEAVRSAVKYMQKIVQQHNKVMEAALKAIA